MIQIMKLQCSIHFFSLNCHGRSVEATCHGVSAAHIFMNMEGKFVVFSLLDVDVCFI